MESLSQLHPIFQAFLAACFCWAVTALGSALVFFTREVKQALLDTMEGFASGVMIAAAQRKARNGQISPIEAKHADSVAANV